MNPGFRHAVIPAYLLLCLLLGGASGAGVFANLLLQLLALPIILWSLLAERRTPMSAPARTLLLLATLAVLLVLFQLVPLPPDLWRSLPGREQIAQGYALLGQPLPWLPISLAPHATVTSALSLLPPLAVLLGILRLGGFRASWITIVVLSVTALAIAIGIAQFGSGAGSQWYFYRHTNFGVATGFFANANHMASLLVIALPFVTALYVASTGKSQRKSSSHSMLVVLIGALAMFLVGIATNGSLAGVGLAVPALAGSLLMLMYRDRSLPVWTAVLLLGLAVAAVLVALRIPLDGAGSGADASLASRGEMMAVSAEAIEDHLPVGSGLGTFVELYPRYEDPNDVSGVYVNHAHNDYLELLLELGVPGVLLLALFLLWWGRRIVAIWRNEHSSAFARAATIATAVLIAHSVVDYPLRTAALAALFAACCALLTEPLPWGSSRGRQGSRKARHLSAD